MTDALTLMGCKQSKRTKAPEGDYVNAYLNINRDEVAFQLSRHGSMLMSFQSKELKGAGGIEGYSTPIEGGYYYWLVIGGEDSLTNHIRELGVKCLFLAKQFVGMELIGNYFLFENYP